MDVKVSADKHGSCLLRIPGVSRLVGRLAERWVGVTATASLNLMDLDVSPALLPGGFRAWKPNPPGKSISVDSNIFQLTAVIAIHRSSKNSAILNDQ